MLYATTVEFKTLEEKENHQDFVVYVRTRGMTFRGWLIEHERKVVRAVKSREGEAKR